MSGNFLSVSNPTIEQQELATLIPNSRLVFLESHHGHDAFLMDMEALNNILFHIH